MKSTENVLSVVQNSFPHIDEVTPLNDGDRACLEGIHDVLRRHGKLDRFGVTLLHRHFDLKPGEVMVEETDIEARMQTLSPQLIGTIIDGKIMGTSWSLADGPTMTTGCYRVCVVRDNRHSSTHGKMSG